jgi:hypothetical protein
MKKIYPSSAAFCWGDMVLTDYPSGCLRRALLTAHGVRDGDIPELSKLVGAFHEDRYEEWLTTEQEFPFHKEHSFRFEVAPDVIASGRCDYITYEPYPVIHECKASTSKYALSPLRAGKIRLNHLAQLVFYLTFFRVCRGYVVSSVYAVGEEKREGKDFTVLGERKFTVEIEDTGRIMVDSKFSGYMVQDQLEHQQSSATAINDHVVWERPSGAEDKFGGCCKMCPYQGTCNRWDSGELETTDDFINHAKERI